MSEVRLPLLRDAHVRHTQTTHSTANMVAQRVLAFQQVEGSEDSAQIGHRVEENGPGTDDGRLSTSSAARSEHRDWVLTTEEMKYYGREMKI